jgi:hypothetical protein
MRRNSLSSIFIVGLKVIEVVVKVGCLIEHFMITANDLKLAYAVV